MSAAALSLLPDCFPQLTWDSISRMIAFILSFAFWIASHMEQSQRSPPDPDIAKVLGQFFKGGRRKQMELEQATVCVQLGKRRQRLGGKSAAPEQAGCLAGAMEWIVPLKETVVCWLIGNPMKLLPLPHRRRPPCAGFQESRRAAANW